MDSDAIATIIALLLIPVAFLVGHWLLSRQVKELQRTVSRMERETVRAATGTQSTADQLDRMEEETHTVAKKRAGIASDLAGSVSRADAADGQPGAAADAALRTGTSPN